LKMYQIVIDEVLRRELQELTKLIKEVNEKLNVLLLKPRHEFIMPRNLWEREFLET